MYLVMHVCFGHKTDYKSGLKYRYQAEKIANRMNDTVLDRLNEGYGVRTENEWFEETGGIVFHGR